MVNYGVHTWRSSPTTSSRVGKLPSTAQRLLLSDESLLAAHSTRMRHVVPTCMVKLVLFKENGSPFAASSSVFEATVADQ